MSKKTWVVSLGKRWNWWNPLGRCFAGQGESV